MYRLTEVDLTPAKGFLPGAEVKKKGALNAGLRECKISFESSTSKF